MDKEEKVTLDKIAKVLNKRLKCHKGYNYNLTKVSAEPPPFEQWEVDEVLSKARWWRNIRYLKCLFRGHPGRLMLFPDYCWFCGKFIKTKHRIAPR